MRQLLSFTALVIILAFGCQTNNTAIAQGYKIEVKIKGVENQEIILGHYRNANLIPYDTVTTDRRGVGIFQGNEPLQQGMYFIFLPSKNYFDFIIGKEQHFTIENDTTNLFTNFKSNGSKELELFIEYRQLLLSQNETITKLREQHKNETDPQKKADIEQEMNLLAQNAESFMDNIISNNPDMFFSIFLKATRDIKVPEHITDRKQQYYYYKNNYFENFDVSDIRLLYTPIYENKINNYLDRVIIQDPDTLIMAVDYLLEQADSDHDLYRFMLIHLFNKYASSSMMIAENLYVHLGQIYVERAHWSEESFINELQTRINRKKNCLIGNNALQLTLNAVPNDSLSIELVRLPLEVMKERGLSLESDESKTFEQILPELSQYIAEYLSYFPEEKKLYDVTAKYTILWFIAPDCSHCKVETPKFYKKYVEELKDKNVEVWAIFLESNTDNWGKFSDHIANWFSFIQQHQMYEWNNVWNPFDNFRFKYDISSSPVLYLLDKDKKILAKRIGYEQAVEIINELEKMHQ
jgi:hypothetical protein